MLWHELSQSAGLLDWAGRYPYMYVHVDISFDYLSAVARYVRASGDVDFLTAHWSAIESAYGYCKSLLDPADGLPRIPSTKEGGNEQDRLTDDLSLSVSWMSAAKGYAQMAAMSGYAAEAFRGASTRRSCSAIRPPTLLGSKTQFLDRRL